MRPSFEDLKPLEKPVRQLLQKLTNGNALLEEIRWMKYAFNEAASREMISLYQTLRICSICMAIGVGREADHRPIDAEKNQRLVLRQEFLIVLHIIKTQLQIIIYAEFKPYPSLASLLRWMWRKLRTALDLLWLRFWWQPLS